MQKRFWLAEVYEVNASERLAEVLSTSFGGPVVVYSIRVAVMANWKDRAPGEGVPLHLRQVRHFRPIAPLTGSADQVFWLMSRVDIEYSLRGVDLVRFITDDTVAPDHDPNLTFKRVT